MGQSVVINMVISAAELERWYGGDAQNVLAYSVDGRRVRFPAGILRPYVTHRGVDGTFRIQFDDQGRFQQIEKIR